MDNRQHIVANINEIYRRESRRVLATLIRLLRDFDLAEEALHDAFIAALAKWPLEGVPQNPRAWLVSTGRFKAIDHLRRRALFNKSLAGIAEELESAVSDSEEWFNDSIEDDQLKLIFTCCHPSLSIEAQLALTLREVCGLTTEEIARAFLATPPTIAQRIVRAKNKIRDAAIPYEIPAQHELPARLNAVLHTIYLLFNEGYSASSGDLLTRQHLTQEAIRLGRLLIELIPQSEVLGLLGLMLVQDSRTTARMDSEGNLLTLEQQNRSLWNRLQIAEASQFIQRALTMGGFGVYSVQAAIAAVHAEATNYADTDWPEIIGLYDLLLRMSPSPVIELNRAVALAMRDGAEAGLQVIDAISARGELQDYYLLHAARADFYRQLGQLDAARSSYQQALALTQQEPERRFLREKIARLSA
ncbi:DNA-directed RNA polymerase sigma-70 factor [Cellvibrio zantedeschiae]|uniref:DNA-directed RNA polymerase sigma-70 factor n=1 Tax=Cellvibrio zantedeschiae TaxID=1237077 RepID=A0ABQ3AS97_9GAMM|nr:RNA polymerase sigma factor [Cellvibrio zantedeschiae]GGY65258.1 DNA-directed RNA polymerase sigma-70 factor [Cellvibrio zantedeschiae]